jgi:hypothetical protein
LCRGFSHLGINVWNYIADMEKVLYGIGLSSGIITYLVLLIFLIKKTRSLNKPSKFLVYFFYFLINEILFLTLYTLFSYKVILLPPTFKYYWDFFANVSYTTAALLLTTKCFSLLNKRKHLFSLIITIMLFILQLINKLFLNDQFMHFFYLFISSVHIYNSIFTFYLLADDLAQLKMINKTRYYFSIAILCAALPSVIITLSGNLYGATGNLGIIFTIIRPIGILMMNYFFYKAIKQYI